MAGDSVIVRESDEVIFDEGTLDADIPVGGLIMRTGGDTIAPVDGTQSDGYSPKVLGLPFQPEYVLGDTLPANERGRFYDRLSGTETRVPADGTASEGDEVAIDGTGVTLADAVAGDGKAVTDEDDDGFIVVRWY